jgi:hypothetical protein
MSQENCLHENIDIKLGKAVGMLHHFCVIECILCKTELYKKIGEIGDIKNWLIKNNYDIPEDL